MKAYLCLRIFITLIFRHIFTTALKLSVQGIDECPHSAYSSKIAVFTYEVQCAAMCRFGYSCQGLCVTEAPDGFLCEIFAMDLNFANAYKVPRANTTMYWAADLIGFKRFGKKAYIHSSLSVTFSSAVFRCTLLKARLAVPMASIELSHLISMSSIAYRWIYVTDIASEGSYRNGITGNTYSFLLVISPTSTATNCLVYRAADAYMFEANCTDHYYPYTCEVDIDTHG